MPGLLTPKRPAPPAADGQEPKQPRLISQLLAENVPPLLPSEALEASEPAGSGESMPASAMLASLGLQARTASAGAAHSQEDLTTFEALLGRAESLVADLGAMPEQAVEQQLQQAMRAAALPDVGTSAVAIPAPDPPPDMVFGFVKQKLPQKGFSLIITDPSNDADTVYMHHTVADPQILSINQPVGFKIHLNSKGQRQASAPIWLLYGHVEANAEVSWGAFQGKVGKILPKGCGFVDCAEASQRFGREVYIHENLVSKCFLEVGDSIRFDVMMNKDGMPQVQSPIWKETLMTRQKGKGGPKGAVQQEGSMGSGKQSGIIVGRVSYQNYDKGLTMVTCSKGGGGKDAIIHSSVAEPSSMAVGDVVAFWPQKASKGEPQAAAPVWKLVGDFQHIKGPPTFGDYQGQVAKVMPNGSSFISCQACQQDHGRDAYCHNQVMESCNYKEGDLIAFDLHLNNRGMPQVSAPTWICLSNVDPATIINKGKGKGKDAGGCDAWGSGGCKGVPDAGFGKAKGSGWGDWDGWGGGWDNMWPGWDNWDNWGSDWLSWFMPLFSGWGKGGGGDDDWKGKGGKGNDGKSENGIHGKDFAFNGKDSTFKGKGAAFEGKGFGGGKGFEGKGFGGKGFECKGFDGKGFEGKGFEGKGGKGAVFGCGDAQADG